MTGKERALNAMLNKPIDRISVQPAIDVSYAASLYGKNVGDCFINPKTHAKALEHVFSVHPGIDSLYINLCLSSRSLVDYRMENNTTHILDNGGMAWFVPANDVGTVKSHEIKDINDQRLITQNPLKDGIVDTYKSISDDMKNKYLFIPGLTGPFSQLVFMLGLTETLLLIYEQPVEMKQALEWRTQKAIEWADELINIGVDCIWIGEGAASSSIISPDTYSEFVLPYASRVVNYLKLHGVVTIMHVCGDTNQSVGIIAKTNVDAIDIDHMVDLEKARIAIDRQICLRGNLNPVDLLNLSCDAVLDQCRKIIHSGGTPLVLSTGCLVARDTPRENIEAMVAASITD